MKYFKERFDTANSYIKEKILKLLVVMLIIFTAVGIVSYFIAKQLPEDSMPEVMAELAELYNIQDDGGISSTKLFLNNIRATAVTTLSGFIPFLFIPIISIAFNGGILGFVMGIMENVLQENVFVLFLKFILPHGIFEIPALLLGAALGTRLCITVCKKIFKKAGDEKISYHMNGIISIFLVYIIPFLVVAAFIEGTVLPMVFK